MSGMGSVIGAELPNPGMQISRGAAVGDWQFGWHGVKRWTYFLQQSPNALGWSYLPWLASGDDGPLGLTVRSSASAGFFRLRATDRSVADPWTADFDGDGVGNGDELLQGTDPLHTADTDGDGIPDDWETAYGLNRSDPADATQTAAGGGIDQPAALLNGIESPQRTSATHNHRRCRCPRSERRHAALPHR